MRGLTKGPAELDAGKVHAENLKNQQAPAPFPISRRDVAGMMGIGLKYPPNNPGW